MRCANSKWESGYHTPNGAVRMIRAGRANSVNSVKAALRRANSALLFMKMAIFSSCARLTWPAGGAGAAQRAAALALKS